MKNILLSITILSIIILLSTISNSDELTQETNNYCEMVDIFKADNSKGWPDYKNIYNTTCTKKE